MSPRFSLWRVLRTLVVITIVACAVLSTQDSGYARLGPGPVSELPVANGTGRWLVLTVGAEEVSRAEVLWTAWTRERLVRLVPGTGDTDMEASLVAAASAASQLHGSDVPVPYRLGEVSGPSAGLTLALASLDNVLGGQLSDGRRIAVTGEIDPNGVVYPIGGWTEKAQAVVLADADLLIVPREEEALFRGLVGDTLVIGVASLDEAVAAVCATSTQQPAVCVR